jgi:ERCC4-related helicase
VITKFHAKYYAILLTQQSIGGDLDSLSQSLLNAAVDINPHQIEAALAAFKSPLSKGIILADEVGLGKTIEAGLVLCQYWALGRRKIIVVCPASLRKQWGFELTEKFGIDNEILDTKTYNEYIRDGKHPFAQKKVIICSYNFASQKKDEISIFGFHLAIIDEAHKLRNVYKPKSKTAHNIKDAFPRTKKLLLTATPFQNSVMELYGLTTIIDENIFGDVHSFRSEYVNQSNFKELRERIIPYYKRTLRKDVSEYINYTKRLPLTQQFQATNTEQELYNAVSEFLRRDDLFSVPIQQQALVTMIIRKILASSTYALLGTFQKILDRLERILTSRKKETVSVKDFLDDDELTLYDEDRDDEASFAADSDSDIAEQKELALYDDDGVDIKALKKEIEEIKGFMETAKTISRDTKSVSLTQALNKGFEQLEKTGAAKKALIFTESIRTQTYLKEFLESNGYAGKVVLFNGKNGDEFSGKIYSEWKAKNAYTGRISNIKTADIRAAIVDYFEEAAEIMVATEAAAEGLNMQFCSLVVNYDLPWNPQRIEQRIGRCHRYGQKSDVVVVNFVNLNNYADIRVFDILNEKFHLFDTIFGTSDEVLGRTDGIDFEKRIHTIYQECRTEAEINAAFEKLQNEMQDKIDTRISEIKEQVLENFDIEVQERLKLAKENTRAFLSRHEYLFWELTKYIIGDNAAFNDLNHTFTLAKPVSNFLPGKYRLYSSPVEEGESYRLSHPLAQYVLQEALKINTGNGGIIISEEKTSLNVTLPDYIKGQTGYLLLSALKVSAFDTEEYCLFTAYTKNGTPLSQEECERLFLCSGSEISNTVFNNVFMDKLEKSSEQHRKSKLQDIDSRNLSFFRAEEDRIFRWEKDLINAIEQELDAVKRQIREQERRSRTAATMEEKIAAERKIDELEREKRKKRHELSIREDEIGQKRRKLLADLDSRMVKQTQSDDIFIIEWKCA